MTPFAEKRRPWHCICVLIQTITGACLLTLYCGSAEAQSTEPTAPPSPPTKLESADKQYVVEMRHNDRAASYDDERLLIISRNGKQIAMQKTFGYLTGDAFWNAAGSLVAINNRRANAGDYVWIFSLPDGRCLKSADSPQFHFIEKAADNAFQKLDGRTVAKELEKEWIYAGQWLGDDNTLLINLSRRYAFARKESNSPSFDFDALVRVTGPRFELLWGAGRKTDRRDPASSMSSPSSAPSNEDTRLVTQRVNGFFKKYQTHQYRVVERELRAEYLTKRYQQERAEEDKHPENTDGDPYTLADAAAPWEVGVIEVKVVEIQGARAEASVTRAGQDHGMKVLLIKEGGKWLIDKIYFARR